MQLFLDMDGVLADFDRAAKPLMDGMHPEDFDKTFGQNAFWERINTDPKFFRNLKKMWDADHLFEAVKHLNPIILTGIPRDMDPLENQKHEWAMEHFPNIKVISCRARKKSAHMQPGDVLVDDRTIYKHLWEKAGGIYVVHTSAQNSIQQLKALGVL